MDRLSTGQACHRLQIERRTVGNRLVAKPLKSPQLPCYSQVIADVEIIAIGQVSINEPGYLTLAPTLVLMMLTRKVKSHGSRWCERVSWLERSVAGGSGVFGRAFVNGSGTPTPSPSACRYCHYAAICRAHAVSDWDAEEEFRVVTQPSVMRSWIPKSFCVTAPAGSGKTSLLTQRVLALLATVERPEQVLAITFTRKAAAEMRERVMEALDAVKQGIQAENEHEARTQSLADAVLAHSRALHWSLTAESLNIRTIDGLARN